MNTDRTFRQKRPSQICLCPFCARKCAHTRYHRTSWHTNQTDSERLQFTKVACHDVNTHNNIHIASEARNRHDLRHSLSCRLLFQTSCSARLFEIKDDVSDLWRHTCMFHSWLALTARCPLHMGRSIEWYTGSSAIFKSALVQISFSWME